MEQNPSVIRLHQIGKVARTLLDEPPADQSSAGSDDSVGKPQDECRLFFDYLRGNYKDAEADLDVLASRAATPDLRFRLLALRAQVLHARDMTHQARAVIDYLLKVQGVQARRVEETPAGMVLTQVDDPARLWTRYLSQRLIDKSPAAKSSPGDNPGENEEGIDLRIPIPMDGFDGRVIKEGIEFPRRRPGLGGFGPGMAPGPGAGRMALACSASSVFSIRSRRNRQSRAARFNSDSAGSIAPVKVSGSELPSHAAKLRLMGILFPMQAWSVISLLDFTGHYSLVRAGSPDPPVLCERRSPCP